MGNASISNQFQKACKKGDVVKVKNLLENHTIEELDIPKGKAAINACKYGKLQVVKILLEKKFDFTFENCLPLRWAFDYHDDVANYLHSQGIRASYAFYCAASYRKEIATGW